MKPENNSTFSKRKIAITVSVIMLFGSVYAIWAGAVTFTDPTFMADGNPISAVKMHQHFKDVTDTIQLIPDWVKSPNVTTGPNAGFAGNGLSGVVK